MSAKEWALARELVEAVWSLRGERAGVVLAELLGNP